jgi:hypothetical protein
MSSDESNSETVAVTMTPAAAQHFYRALSWATAAAANRADEWDGRFPERAQRFREHGEWLRWGMGRISSVVPEVIDG